MSDAGSSSGEYKDALDQEVGLIVRGRKRKGVWKEEEELEERMECRSVVQTKYVDQRMNSKMVSVRDEVKGMYVGKLKRREEEIDRLWDKVRNLRESLREEGVEVRKERDRCARLRRENCELLEKVRYWEKIDAEKNERKRKLMEEQEEVARTRMRIRIEEEEREKIQQERNHMWRH